MNAAAAGRSRIAVLVPPSLRAVFFAESSYATLRALGDVVLQEEEHALKRADELLRYLAEADVLVTSWGCPPLTTEVLEHAPRLRLVAHTGATVKSFVTPELFARRVTVTQAGAGMAPAVAETCLTLCLILLHHVHRHDRALHGGADWERAQSPGIAEELVAQRVGVVGASRTGKAFITMVRALGAETWVYDPYLSEETARMLGVRRAALDELLRSCTIVALHAPSTTETRHLIGARELALLPDGACLVNTARSWLVDEAALLAELRIGRIRAGLDVFDEEPLPADSPFRSLDNVVLMPHQAGNTRQARWHQGKIVVAEIGRFLRGEALRNEVRPESLAITG